MKFPKRLFRNWPTPETLRRWDAQILETTKGLPSRRPDCPPGYIAMIDDLLLKTFGESARPVMGPGGMRDAAEMIFVGTMQAHHNGKSLEGFLFEFLAESDTSSELKEFTETLGDKAAERLIRFCWGVWESQAAS